MILTAVLLVGMTVPAFAAVQNVKVGGDITIRGIYRSDFDFTKNATAVFPANKDTCGWLMTTTRIYVTSELTDGVAAVVRLINERDWANTTRVAENDTRIDLDLAYIKLTDIAVPGLTATIGRQEILLGEGFIIGHANPNRVNAGASTVAPIPVATGNILATDYEARKAFDALRLDYEVATIPLTLTGFVAKIDEEYATNVGGFGTDVGVDDDLYGINANYQLATAEIEGYFIDFKNSHVTKNTANKFDYQTWGARLAHNVAAVPGFSYRGEIAFQRGTRDSLGATAIDLKNEAMAGYIGGAYAFQNISWEPKIGLTYNYFSGDNKTAALAPQDDKNQAWTSLFPDGMADRIGAIGYGRFGVPGKGAFVAGAPTLLNNEGGLQVLKLNGSVQPTEKLNISLAWFNSSLVKKVALTPQDKKDIGNEFDLGLTYAYSEDVSMGLLLGYFIRGDVVKNNIEAATGAGTSTNAMEVVGTVAVCF